MLVFALGVVTALGAEKFWTAAASCDAQFSLLNPDANCVDEQKGLDEWAYDPLRQRLIQAIEHYTTTGKVPHIALSFRDLKNGPRFSIRENEIFEPVSLLKLPIMMVILHQADRYPTFLDERISYEKEYEDIKNYILGDKEQSLKLHATYTIGELLERMIRYSDNTSSYLLLDRINELGLRMNSNTFADFGTMQLLMSGELDNTRLLSLVNIFVAFYNANYLSPSLSQFALELLTQTSFDKGIVGGVPDGVLVAHKFGIRLGPVEQSELHDCGIVYHPSAPYVLCILTAGADIDTASAAIRDISKIVYEGVDTLNDGR